MGDAPQGALDGVTNNPVKTGGVARTANPTAVIDSQRVGASYDDLGRQVITLYQVRDLVNTDRVSITASGEQTLLAGVASTFLDLMEITAANQSTNAVSISIRSATGGGIVRDFEVPANNTISRQFPVPVPQNVVADAWTAQVDDFVSDGTTSNGTVIIDALFIRNI